MNTERVGKRGLIVVLAGVALFRFFVLFSTHQQDNTAMALKLGETARNVMNGHGFAWDPLYLQMLNEESLKQDPLRPQWEVFEKTPPPMFDASRLQSFRGRPPGYSVILSVLWTLTGHLKFIYAQILFCLLDLVTVFLLWWLANALFGSRPALGAAFLYGFHISFALLSINPSHDAMSSFPLIAGACLLYWAIKKSWWFFIPAGILFGAASLIRQEPMFIPIVFAGALFLAGMKKRAFQALLLMQGLVILMNVPWNLRAKQQFGESSPFTHSFSALLLEGIGETPNPWGIQASDVWLRGFVKGKGVDTPFHSKDFNRVCMEEFSRIVRENPAWVAGSVVKRAVRCLMPTVMPIESSFYFYSTVLKKEGGFGGYVREHPLHMGVTAGLKGLWLLLWFGSIWTVVVVVRSGDQERKALVLALGGISVYYFLTHIPMHCEYRYLLPGYAPLVLCGVNGWFQMLGKKKG